MKVARVFVSHSSRDEAQASVLFEWLKSEGFDDSFLDFDKHAGISPGADWERTLYREIAAAEAVILVMTSNWLESKWCFAEFTQARALGKAIFPLIETPTGERIIAADIQSLDLTVDRQGGLERLSAELAAIAQDAQHDFAWDPVRPPFPGLLAFDEADAAVYFGRDTETKRLIERLNVGRTRGGARFVSVLGSSGSGKSSLLRAGVRPRLARDQKNWLLIPIFRPGASPAQELAQSVAIATQEAGDWRNWVSKLTGATAAENWASMARDLRAQSGHNEAQILITIDQAEELFTTARPDERALFLAMLKGALSEAVPITVMACFRSEFVDEANALPVETEEFVLQPMPIDRVRHIIEGPARLAGLSVEEGLAEEIIADANVPDALPLIAFALRELYDTRSGDGHLSLAAYRLLGDRSTELSPLENIVRTRADQILDNAKPTRTELKALREAFIPALVQVNEKGEYVRRPALRSKLPESALRLLDCLADGRLLTTKQGAADRQIEVVHEALLRKWPRLRDWLDEERDLLTLIPKLDAAVAKAKSSSPFHRHRHFLSAEDTRKSRLYRKRNKKNISRDEKMFISANAAQFSSELEGRIVLVLYTFIMICAGVAGMISEALRRVLPVWANKLDPESKKAILDITDTVLPIMTEASLLTSLFMAVFLIWSSLHSLIVKKLTSMFMFAKGRSLIIGFGSSIVMMYVMFISCLVLAYGLGSDLTRDLISENPFPEYIHYPKYELREWILDYMGIVEPPDQSEPP